MFPALGAVLGLLHPDAGGALRRGLKFQTCTNTLNIFFNNSRNFWVPPPPPHIGSNTNIMPMKTQFSHIPRIIKVCIRNKAINTHTHTQRCISLNYMFVTRSVYTTYKMCSHRFSYCIKCTVYGVENTPKYILITARHSLSVGRISHCTMGREIV